MVVVEQVEVVEQFEEVEEFPGVIRAREGERDTVSPAAPTCVVHPAEVLAR